MKKQLKDYLVIKPKKKMLQVKVDESLLKDLHAVSDKMKITIQATVEVALKMLRDSI